MTELGDVDPEDAWDDGDSFADRVHILFAVVEHLSEQSYHDDRHEARRVDALRLLAKLEAERSTHPRLAELREALEAL